MMAAALVGSSFLQKGIGKLAKDSLDSSKGLSSKISAIFIEKIVIYLILLEGPAAFTDFPLDRKSQFLHSVIIRLENILFAALAL
jgi:hypothetical protein